MSRRSKKKKKKENARRTHRGGGREGKMTPGKINVGNRYLFEDFRIVVLYSGLGVCGSF